jgi:phage terminase large subunit-like protein
VSEPFTLEHFEEWAATLELDDGRPWVLDPYQELFVDDLFDPTIRVLWLIVPEENGKTTLIAGLGLYYLEFLPHAAIPVAAAAKEQADILYAQAEGFVMRTKRMHELVPDLVRQAKGLKPKRSDLYGQVPRFECQEGFRRIRYHKGGRIQIRAADDRTGDGIIPAGIEIIEELHRHRNLKLYNTWLGKLDKRKAKIVVISTAGEPGTDFEEERTMMRQNASEIQREETFTRAQDGERVLHDWAVPEGGDPEDFDLVARANPASWVTAETLKAKFDRLGKSGGTIQHWRRFVCNLPTRSERAAIQEAEWYAAQTDEEIPEGEPIWVGLDVAWKWDTTAAVPLWIRDEQFRLLGPARVLVPPRDGTSLDPALVERGLIEINNRNPIHTVVMDMSRAEQLADWIEAELGATVIERGQSNKLAVADYEKFMEALRQGWLKHSGDRGLTQHALNAIARVLPQGDARFERPAQNRISQEQDRRVIDALIAAAMVHSVASSGSSVYESRGMVMV